MKWREMNEQRKKERRKGRDKRKKGVKEGRDWQTK